jgi:undecaprenyl-diphosphatase
MDIGSWDRALLHAINGYAHRSPPFDHAVYMLANTDLLAGGLFFLYVWWLWFLPPPANPSVSTASPRTEAVRVVLGLLTAVILARCAQLFLPLRLRPLHDPSLSLAMPYFAPATVLEHWSSFPSDHAVVLFAIVAAIWRRSRALGAIGGLWVLLFGCLPRIFLGYHYPSDILGGAVLGIAVMSLALDLRLPDPAARALSAPLGWERRWPAIFYPAFVLLTWELITLFEEARYVARGLASLVLGRQI